MTNSKNTTKKVTENKTTKTTKKGATTMKKTSNSIIDVTVNGLSAMQTVDEVKTRLESVEKSVFNIALLCTYGVGVEIPTYTDIQGVTHGQAVCEKPIKQADYIKLVGRSKQTISRWIGAMKLIIENGVFSVFAKGELPFSYDKIHIIFKEENKDKFSDYTLADLFNLSVDTLENMVSKTTEETEETEENTTSEVSEETEVETTEETVFFTYDGKEYSVVKTLLESFISENCTLK